MSLFRMTVSGHNRESDALPQDRISLVDSTVPQLERDSSERGSDELSRAPSTVPSTTGRRLQLREELARRKYAKYQASRTESVRRGPLGHTRTASSVDVDQQLASTQTNTDAEEQYAIDVLYENQRGWFLCGIPLFSHKSLLNFDPSAWVTATFKDSPVDITNAQLPDPTWDWAWKSWYVDMSSDVDEEGWQYSFSFQKGFAWHGTHVWYHSFVRRRRWLRKRVKKRNRGDRRDVADTRSSVQEQMLNDDYFTIHPGRTNQAISNRGSRASFDNSVSTDTRKTKEDEEINDLDEIRDIASLLKYLRMSKIDRERVEAVEKFLDAGADEVIYLPEKIPYIMSLLVFQYSRRQLLACLVDRYNKASENQTDPTQDDAPENSGDKLRVQGIQKAMEVADEEVKKLEYWSDVRHMVQKGQTKGAVDPKSGWNDEWQGIDASGPATISDNK